MSFVVRLAKTGWIIAHNIATQAMVAHVTMTCGVLKHLTLVNVGRVATGVSILALLEQDVPRCV
mgnify:CR=1 FL=1